MKGCAIYEIMLLLSSPLVRVPGGSFVFLSIRSCKLGQGPQGYVRYPSL